MTESIPAGKDGNMPRGLFIPLFLSSQKHRGHTRKRFSDDGDNLILLFLNIWPAKLPNQSFAAACYVSLLKTKKPIPPILNEWVLL